MDTRPNDLMHWQTTLVVKDAEAIAKRLGMNRSAFVSSSVVKLTEGKLGF